MTCLKLIGCCCSCTEVTYPEVIGAFETCWGFGKSGLSADGSTTFWCSWVEKIDSFGSRKNTTTAVCYQRSAASCMKVWCQSWIVGESKCWLGLSRTGFLPS